MMNPDPRSLRLACKLPPARLGRCWHPVLPVLGEPGSPALGLGWALAEPGVSRAQGTFGRRAPGHWAPSDLAGPV